MNPNRSPNQGVSHFPEKCGNRFDATPCGPATPLRSSLKKSCTTSPEYSEACTPISPARQISYRSDTSGLMETRETSHDDGPSGSRWVGSAGSPRACSKGQEQEVPRRSQNSGNGCNQPVVGKAKPEYRLGVGRATFYGTCPASDPTPTPRSYSGERSPPARMDTSGQYGVAALARTVQKLRDSYENGRVQLGQTMENGLRGRQYSRGAYLFGRKESPTPRLHSGANKPESSKKNNKASPPENKSPTMLPSSQNENPPLPNGTCDCPATQPIEPDGTEITRDSNSQRPSFIRRSIDNATIEKSKSPDQGNLPNSSAPETYQKPMSGYQEDDNGGYEDYAGGAPARADAGNCNCKEERPSVSTAPRNDDDQYNPRYQEERPSVSKSARNDEDKFNPRYQEERPSVSKSARNDDDQCNCNYPEERQSASKFPCNDDDQCQLYYGQERPSVSKSARNDDNPYNRRYEEERKSVSKTPRNSYDDDSERRAKPHGCKQRCGRALHPSEVDESSSSSREHVPQNRDRNCNLNAYTCGSTSHKSRGGTGCGRPSKQPDDCDCAAKARGQRPENLHGPCLDDEPSDISEVDESQPSRKRPSKSCASNRSKQSKKETYCDESNCRALNMGEDMDCGCTARGQVNNGSRLTVKEIIVCALRCEIMGYTMESLSLYEECIRRLRKKLTCEDLPETKAREIRQYLRNYESHAQRLRRHIQRRLFDSKLIEQIDIADNSNGNSYEKLFGKYLDDRVTEAHIYEPYMTDHCHFRNLISFLELLVKHCPNIRYIRLSTKKDVSQDSDQKETLRDICDQMESVNVAFNFRYDENLLDHKIILSNGVIIDMTRGLHYFKPWHGEYALGLCDYDFRRCCRTKIEIWLTTPFADDTNPNQNGPVCNCESTDKLDRDYFPD